VLDAQGGRLEDKAMPGEIANARAVPIPCDAVRIAVDVGIWFGTILRGDNEAIEIGTRSNVQEGAMCTPIPASHSLSFRM
jgi:hypothetical protein